MNTRPSREQSAPALDMKALTRAIALELQVALKRTGVEQKDIADHFGYNQGWLSRRFTGVTDFEPATMIAVCNYLGLDAMEVWRDAREAVESGRVVAPKPARRYTRTRGVSGKTSQDETEVELSVDKTN